MKKILEKHRVMSNRDDFPMEDVTFISCASVLSQVKASTSQRKRTPISMSAASAVLR